MTDAVQIQAIDTAGNAVTLAVKFIFNRLGEGSAGAEDELTDGPDVARMRSLLEVIGSCETLALARVDGRLCWFGALEVDDTEIQTDQERQEWLANWTMGLPLYARDIEQASAGKVQVYIPVTKGCFESGLGLMAIAPVGEGDHSLASIMDEAILANWQSNEHCAARIAALQAE